MISKKDNGKSKLNKALRLTAKILIPLTIGVFILWLLYRNMDVDALLETLQSDADFGILVLAAFFGTVGNTFRGMRWQILNKSLSLNARAINSILTTHGNYTLNMALPRLGEVWRCAAMAHYSRMSFSSLFGTLIIDRAYDIVVMLLLLLLGMFLNLGFFSDFFRENPGFIESLQRIFSSPWFYVALILVIIGVIFFVKSLGRGKFGQKIKEQLDNVWNGLKTVVSMDRKWLFYLYTIGIWAGYFLQFYLAFFAFSFTAHLSPAIALIAFLMGAIAIAAPVQGGMGAWHFMVIYTLVFFGIETGDAQNFALIVHTSQQFIWNPLIGLICIGLLPLINKKYKKEELDIDHERED